MIRRLLCGRALLPPTAAAAAAARAGADDSVQVATDHSRDDLWEESFGNHRDSKPFGPASVGMDITYEGASHVYGLAEHAAPLNLPSTTGPGAKYKDPYRMYTLDVYDYELDSPMALYGGACARSRCEPPRLPVSSRPRVGMRGRPLRDRPPST